MFYLCVETSSKLGSLALAKKSNELAFTDQKQWMRSKDIKNKKVFSHAEFITTEFQSLLDSQESTIHDLEGLILTHGPGSFTGLRVGLNFVKSLGYSLNIPIYSIDTLTSIAFAAKELNENLHVVVNAQKNLVFYAHYKYENNQLKILEPPQLRSIKDVKIHKTHLYLGDGLRQLSDVNIAEDEYIYPNAKTLIQLFNTHFDFFQKNQWNSLKPLYLKASEAEENLKKGLLKPIT